MYNTYIPINIHNRSKKGVAVSIEYESLDDLTNLNCSWYYNWAHKTNIADIPGGVEFVPMSFRGEYVGSLRGNNLLVFNEPDNREQAYVLPKDAVDKYYRLIKRYGIDCLIVGGVTYWKGLNWLNLFIDECKIRSIELPKRWHVHGYLEWGLKPQDLISFWEECINLTKGKYYITEYGDINGNIKDTEHLTQYINDNSNIERYSIFCSRVSGEEQWYPKTWPIPSKLGLIKDNNLTELGKYYSNL